MKISVICPTYNAGKTLRTSLLSVINQFDDDFEIVVADGGSTDDTLKIASEFPDSVVRVVSRPDRGQLEAVFNGLDVAEGDIIFWLNADDIVMPGAFKEVRAAFEDESVDFVYSDNYAFDERVRKLYTGASIRFLRRLEHALFYRQLYSETVYFRRYLVPDREEAFFDLRIYTDYYFFLRALDSARGKWLPKRLGAFRIIENQASQRWAAKKEEEFHRVRSHFYSLRGWSRATVILLRLLNSPSFALVQLIFPAVNRALRKLGRLITGDHVRLSQTDVFFDEWVADVPLDGRERKPEDKPGKWHLL